MSNTYRMVQTEPFKVVIQMQTASGWIDCESTQTVPTAKELIKQRKAKEDWVVKIYDEEGNLMGGTVVPTDQPVDNA